MYSVIDSIALGPELADHSKHGEPRNSVERVHARTTLPAPHSTRIRLIHMLADFFICNLVWWGLFWLVPWLGRVSNAGSLLLCCFELLHAWPALISSLPRPALPKSVRGTCLSISYARSRVVHVVWGRLVGRVFNTRSLFLVLFCAVSCTALFEFECPAPRSAQTSKRCVLVEFACVISCGSGCFGSAVGRACPNAIPVAASSVVSCC